MCLTASKATMDMYLLCGQRDFGRGLLHGGGGGMASKSGDKPSYVTHRNGWLVCWWVVDVGLFNAQGLSSLPLFNSLPMADDEDDDHLV